MCTSYMQKYRRNSPTIDEACRDAKRQLKGDSAAVAIIGHRPRLFDYCADVSTFELP
jgi:hypothetical protein